jgi:aldehyde dehydrogenase (NAD+)
VTGKGDALAEVLAAHDDVDGVWHFGSAEGAAAVERLSAGNMKRTWVSYGRALDWREGHDSDELLREASQVKNIWIPYGE